MKRQAKTIPSSLTHHLHNVNRQTHEQQEACLSTQYVQDRAHCIDPLQQQLVLSQPPISQLLTIVQAATYLGVCRAHIYKLIGQGLPTIHLGRLVRINIHSLNNWLAAQEMSQER